MPDPKECVNCGEEFYPKRDKPGKIDECWTCGRKSEKDIVKLGGNMIWEHKTAPTIEIKPLSEARSFAKKTRRFGAGVLASITQPKMTDEERADANKQGANPGSTYYSKTGEKRTVKR